MRSRLGWPHQRGQQVHVERNSTYMPETVVKFMVLAGLLIVPVRILHWGSWVAVAVASLYPLWELARSRAALGELADMWNEQYREQHKDEFGDTGQP